jgi:hypothetical protein
MLKKNIRFYIKNKLINSIKINKMLKSTTIKSLLKSGHLLNLLRATISIKQKLQYSLFTTLNDVCLLSAMRKKSSKLTNLNRYEFHRLCRNNKLSNFITKTW